MSLGLAAAAASPEFAVLGAAIGRSDRLLSIACFWQFGGLLCLFLVFSAVLDEGRRRNYDRRGMRRPVIGEWAGITATEGAICGVSIRFIAALLLPRSQIFPGQVNNSKTSAISARRKRGARCT